MTKDEIHRCETYKQETLNHFELIQDELSE